MRKTGPRELELLALVLRTSKYRAEIRTQAIESLFSKSRLHCIANGQQLSLFEDVGQAVSSLLPQPIPGLWRVEQETPLEEKELGRAQVSPDCPAPGWRRREASRSGPGRKREAREGTSRLLPTPLHWFSWRTADGGCPPAWQRLRCPH